MAKVLVTGGTGFIGNHIVRMLCGERRPVRVLIRSTSQQACLASLPVEVVTGDLSDRASLQRAVDGCEVVFHVAADYRLWARHPQELYRHNVDGTANMLTAAFDSGVTRLVYTSTVGTIGFPEDSTPGTEDSFPDARQLAGDYKKSKFQAEQIALRFAQNGYPVVIVNPTAPVGEGDRKPTETGKIILDFLKRKMPAYIDTGLNLVDVRDVARGHLAAMDRGRPGERYILGGRNMSFKQILDALSKLTGIPAPSIHLPYGIALCAGAADTFLSRITGKPPRIPLEGVRMARHKMYVSSAKAERELGYHASEIDDALERAIAWFRNNGYIDPVTT